MVSVKSKCGRMRWMRTSRHEAVTVATAITLAKTARNDTPPTPVHSAIWINGRSRASPTPRSFQPKPENIQPRTHSWAVQQAAARNANTSSGASAGKRRGGRRRARAASPDDEGRSSGRRRTAGGDDEGGPPKAVLVRSPASVVRAADRAHERAPHGKVERHVKREDEPARRRHFPQPVKRAPEEHESGRVPKGESASACLEDRTWDLDGALRPSSPSGIGDARKRKDRGIRAGVVAAKPDGGEERGQRKPAQPLLVPRRETQHEQHPAR